MFCMSCNYQHGIYSPLRTPLIESLHEISIKLRAVLTSFDKEGRQRVILRTSAGFNKLACYVISRQKTLADLRTWRLLSCSSLCHLRISKLSKDKCRQMNGNAISSLLSDLTSAADVLKREEPALKHDGHFYFVLMSACT